jgi:hypothetical protein
VLVRHIQLLFDAATQHRENFRISGKNPLCTWPDYRDRRLFGEISSAGDWRQPCRLHHRELPVIRSAIFVVIVLAVGAGDSFLMDEPLSSLDAKLRAEMRLELKHIQQDLGATVLYVTHDQTEAMTMANRIGVLDHGRLVQIGSPREIYESPRNIYVATRLGMPSINLLPPQAFPDHNVPSGTKTIGARTEHVAIARANGGAHARVEWIEHLGDQNHLHLTVGDHKLVTLVDPEVDLAVGDAIDITLRRPLYFGADGERIR